MCAMRIALLSFLLIVPAFAGDEDPFKADHVGDGWIHEDIEAGYKQAKATGKPLLVAFK